MNIVLVFILLDIAMILQLAVIDRTINVVRQRVRSLSYLSLLGNPACPDMLTSLDDDLYDYARYRQVDLHHHHAHFITCS